MRLKAGVGHGALYLNGKPENGQDEELWLKGNLGGL